MFKKVLKIQMEESLLLNLRTLKVDKKLMWMNFERELMNILD